MKLQLKNKTMKTIKDHYKELLILNSSEVERMKLAALMSISEAIENISIVNIETAKLMCDIKKVGTVNAQCLLINEAYLNFINNLNKTL
jgi:hypothetical protein